MKRAFAAVGLAAGLGATLAGCGDKAPSPAAPSVEVSTTNHGAYTAVNPAALMAETRQAEVNQNLQPVGRDKVGQLITLVLKKGHAFEDVEYPDKDVNRRFTFTENGTTYQADVLHQTPYGTTNNPVEVLKIRIDDGKSPVLIKDGSSYQARQDGIGSPPDGLIDDVEGISPQNDQAFATQAVSIYGPTQAPVVEAANSVVAHGEKGQADYVNAVDVLLASAGK